MSMDVAIKIEQPVAPAQVQQVPASVVAAICKIQATVDAVKKSQRNAHGGYHFASTDDIYAALTRKMGEVGLACIGLEDEAKLERIEKDGKNGEKVTQQWAKVVFRFVLATEQATWTDAAAKRTLYIQVTGPQTWQAAQSYAEKSYLRSLFKLPTGDLDLDSMPQADNEDDQVALASKQPRKTSAEGKRDGSVKRFNEIRADIAGAVNAEHLAHVRTVHAETWQTMPRAWAETLDEEYQSKMDSLAATQAAE